MDFFASLTSGQVLALLGAALAMILGGVGSARAVSMAGETAAGVLTEDPNKFGATLLLQALPGTQGIYGMIIAFLILLKCGFIGGAPIDLTTAQGLSFLFASLPVAIVGYQSAYRQGRASIAAMNVIAKRPEELGKAMMYPALVETYAVLALLVSFLMWLGINV